MVKVKFKSIPEMYHKEKTGKKSNTLRRIDLNDKRFQYLLNDMCNIIQIENTETKEVFERIITDVTVWEGYCIISWGCI